MPILYLMFVRDGELAGLERGLTVDLGEARREAADLLARDREVLAVEIWSDGRLVGAAPD